MAAAESKHSSGSCEVITHNNEKSSDSQGQTETYEYRTSDLLFHIVCIGIFVADVAADSAAFLDNFLRESFAFGYSTLALCLIPAGIVQLFSLRWHRSDGFLKSTHWILHFLFLGILHRYLILLCTIVSTLRNKQHAKDKSWVYRQESDVCMLRLFQAFMGAAPQLLLQLYVIIISKQASTWAGVSAMASSCSLVWAVVTYTKAMHKARLEDTNAGWMGLSLQLLWRCGMLISRIAVLVLMAVCMRQWFFLAFGLHWLSTSIWVILQKTDLCPTVWEERIYNSIIGLIYCFDFFNVRLGKSRYRVLTFYTIIVTQNVVLLIAYAWYFKDKMQYDLLLIATIAVVGGLTIGLSSMMLYYWKFHPSRGKGLRGSIKNNEAESSANVRTDTPRVLKQHRHGSSAAVPFPSIDISQGNAALDDAVADKQSLLRNIVHDGDCVEDGFVHKSCPTQSDLQDTVRIVSECKTVGHLANDEGNTEKQSGPLEQSESSSDQSENHLDEDIKVIYCQKRRSVSLPISHNLDLEKHVTTNASAPGFSSQRRRGICSLAQLIVEIESNREMPAEKLLSEDVGLTLENTDAKKSADGHSVQLDSEKISALDISKCPLQREETMSCVTSIHDYENVCPLGVARPPWCIRSWKGYTDIETYLHDDSVVRDRRRDTLTSTTTGTTYSSEFSDATCASCFMRGVLRNDDYSDMLTYDLVEPRGWTRSGLNDDSSATICSDVEEHNTSYFIAKPVIIDDKDTVVALDTIFEEHDDSILGSPDSRRDRSACDTVSTLVSTIDQIRRCTAENSPRHVYHRTESQWEDLDPKSLIGKTRLTKIFAEKEQCGNKDHCIIVNENNTNSEIDAIKELVRCRSMKAIKRTPLIEAILSDSPILGNKTKLQKHPSCTDSDESGSNDLYVEMSPLVTAPKGFQITPCSVNDDISKSQASSISKPPLKQLPELRISESQTSGDKRRRPVNRCKRKFSLLRERFEPKSQRLVYVVSPKNTNLPLTCDKENSAPALPPKGNLSSNLATVEKVYENNKLPCSVELDLKEKKSALLNQGMSPSKVFTWNKRRSVDLTAKH